MPERLVIGDTDFSVEMTGDFQYDEVSGKITDEATNGRKTEGINGNAPTVANEENPAIPFALRNVDMKIPQGRLSFTSLIYRCFGMYRWESRYRQIEPASWSPQRDPPDQRAHTTRWYSQLRPTASLGTVRNDSREHPLWQRPLPGGPCQSRTGD